MLKAIRYRTCLLFYTLIQVLRFELWCVLYFYICFLQMRILKVHKALNMIKLELWYLLKLWGQHESVDGYGIFASHVEFWYVLLVETTTVSSFPRFWHFKLLRTLQYAKFSLSLISLSPRFSVWKVFCICSFFVGIFKFFVT